LTLLALAGTARAQEPASAAPADAPRASESAAAPALASEHSKADGKAAPAVEASAAEPSTAKPRKLQLGIAFVPMAAGKVTIAPIGVAEQADAAFAYGLGLSVDYRVFEGLSIGFAPQIAFNVEDKGGQNLTGKQVDLLLRLAYTYGFGDGIHAYAEVLPGYSIILADDRGLGFALAFGAGVAMDVTERAFVNVGAGYEMGFQKFSSRDDKTTFVRVTLGGGYRF
jgi:opacity protein-like surface antigen